jgi:hypothetical protein
MWWIGRSVSGRSHCNKATTIWGDGLEDLSLSTLWYRCNWDNVSDDELILLIPSLVSETERHLRAGIVNSKPADLLHAAPYSRVLARPQ